MTATILNWLPYLLAQATILYCSYVLPTYMRPERRLRSFLTLLATITAVVVATQLVPWRG